jgi:NAD(P)-dependent dehydrogenase (short-subunit alcohol dehydrogenase family)
MAGAESDIGLAIAHTFARGGAFVWVLDHDVEAVQDRLAYTITKHGAGGLTKALALDHFHPVARFNAICLGRAETPFVQSRIMEYSNLENAYREMASTQLNGQMARPTKLPAPRSTSRLTSQP